MSLTVLCLGVIAADPQTRTSSKGNAYVTCQLRVANEDAPVLVSVIAFASTAVSVLQAHAKGDTVAVMGRAKLSSWTDRAGNECHGLSVVAESVLTPYQLAKRRAQVGQARGQHGDASDVSDPTYPQ